MHSLLFGDPTDKRKQGDVVFEVIAFEVALLELFFGLEVVSWGFGAQDAESLVLPYAVGEGEGVRVFPEDWGKGRLFQEVYFVGVRNRAPVVAGLKRTLRRVDDDLVISELDIPLRRQLHEPIQISLFYLRIQPPLVKRIEVMTNMHELGPIEDFVVLLALDVGADEAADPIVGDHDRREDFELAEGLEGYQRKEDQLLGYVGCSFSIVWFGEEFRVVEPDIVDPTVLATMYAELILKMSSRNLYIPLVLEAIPQQIIGFLLLIVLIVGSDDVHLLA